MTIKKDSPKDSKVFDVSKPGETAADPTSRPVIVGHTGTRQQDPMVVEEKTDEKTSPANKEKLVLEPKRELNIEPPSELENSKKDPEPSVQPSEKEETGSGVVDALAEAVTTKKEQAKAKSEDGQKTQEIEKIIASKKYFVHTRLPPGKRHLRLAGVLIILLAGVAVWYFLFGPGRAMWIKPDVDIAANTSSSPAPTQNIKPVTDKQKLTVEYKNPILGFLLDYPKDWKAETGRDSDRPGVDTVTFSSPTQKIKLAAAEGETTVDAFLRLRIHSLNTTDIKKYPTAAFGLSLCKTGAITIEKNDYKLAYINLGSGVNPSKVIVTNEDCSKNKPFIIQDQFQLIGKKNTYSLSLEYVLAEEYLKKSGIIEPSEIALSQKKSIEVSEANWKVPLSYMQANKIIESLKAL